MREIEFRGKVKYGDDKGRWVYGYLYVYNEPKIYSILNENNVIELNQYGSNIPAFINIDPETVGQYTERKDKNDKKIFGGDIIIYTNNQIGVYGIGQKVKGFIVFDEYNQCYISRNKFQKDMNWQYAENVEVIGNIYDNPELLGE